MSRYRQDDIADCVFAVLVILVVAIVLVAVLSGCSADRRTHAVAPPPKQSPVRSAGIQSGRWNSAKLRPADLMRLDKCITLFKRTAGRYDVVERMRAHGMPASVIFALHSRESDNSFARHLHEGSPLTHRTRYEPKGRLPNKPPPYTWEVSAEDALYILKHEDRVAWASTEASLDAIERYNGLGYRSAGRVSPYVWSGTNLYSRGKYVADHRYDPTAVDQQLGCAAILLRMRDRGIRLPWQ